MSHSKRASCVPSAFFIHIFTPIASYTMQVLLRCDVFQTDDSIWWLFVTFLKTPFQVFYFRPPLGAGEYKLSPKNPCKPWNPWLSFYILFLIFDLLSVVSVFSVAKTKSVASVKSVVIILRYETA
jgi:hypothetical protein